jgi:hypothetical protein
VFALALMYFPSSIVRPKMNSLRQSPLGADFQLFDAHDFVRSRLNKCTKNYNCEFRRLALIPRIDIMGFIICSNCIILSLGPNYMRVLCVVLCSNFCSSAARAPIFPLKWPALRKHDIALLSCGLLVVTSSTWPSRLLLLFSPAHRHLISILFE